MKAVKEQPIFKINNQNEYYPEQAHYYQEASCIEDPREG